MKPRAMTAIALIVLGIAAFAYQGITYTTRERVAEIGSLHVTKEKTNRIPLPPIIGAIAMASGILLLVLKRGN